MLLFFTILLSGCGPDDKPVVELTPPPSITTCRAAPAFPTGDFTQRDVAAFIVDLWADYEDCSEKLAAVKKLYDKPLKD